MPQYSDRILKQDLAFPNENEIKTARFLVDSLGVNVLFMAPNRTAGAKTPDIQIDNVCWEIKIPKGSSSRTIENNFRQALKQSPNIVFDLRSINMPTARATNRIEHIFALSKTAKRIIIITKSKKLLELKK